ncbi:MAG: molybdenum cofactor guanylyltransferase [Actinomycetes bacterium]
MRGQIRVIEFDAIVLAGGGARRFGSDKLAHDIDGRPLLDRALDAVTGARTVVVVGPRRATERTVVWAQEEPPGGGPLAGIAAGLPLIRSRYVLLLAGDMPRAATAVNQLVDVLAGSNNPSVPSTSGATDPVRAMVDRHDRLQPLTALWPCDVLTRRLRELGDVQGLAVMRLYDQGEVVRVRATQEATLLDVDTPADLPQGGPEVRASSDPA